MRTAHLFGFAFSALAIGCGNSDASSGSTAASSSTGTFDGGSDCTQSLSASGADDTATVQGALLDATSGSILCFSPGTYHYTDELSLAGSKVTLRGTAGVVFDFSKQVGGANALQITGNGDLVQDIRFENPKGDGIRATEVDGIGFKGVEVIWTNGPVTTNGGYGLYPVSSMHVLIDGCKVSGASDAGVYVGQSKQIVVRNNDVSGNVAGIEIENSTDADVYGNHTHDNTGGILVFALPGLPQLDSARAKIHDNVIEHNNEPNFAAKGNIVTLVPTGTGLFLMASDGNELSHNDVHDNISVGVAIVSWKLANKPANDPKYDIYPESNWVHDNTFAKDGTDPQGQAKLLASAILMTTTLPEMSWDGVVDPMKDNSTGDLTNCFLANGTADFVMFDYDNGGMNKSSDVTPYACTRTELPAIDPTGFPGAD